MYKRQYHNIKTDHTYHSTDNHNNGESYGIAGNTHRNTDDYRNDTYHKSQNDDQHDQGNRYGDFSDKGNDTHHIDHTDCCYHYDNDYHHSNTPHHFFRSIADNGNGYAFQCRSDQHNDYHTYHNPDHTNDLQTHGADNDIPSERHHIFCDFDRNQPHDFYNSHCDGNDQFKAGRQQCFKRNTHHTAQHTDNDKHHDNRKYHL